MAKALLSFSQYINAASAGLTQGSWVAVNVFHKAVFHKHYVIKFSLNKKDLNFDHDTDN